jgi:pimeloyl-ACP methyl ester carboxylesterase
VPGRESLRPLPGARQACLLLVHGGFHGAWCWDRLIVSLTERRVRVEAVEMPFTSFADDVAAVSTAIDRLAADGTRVVAVGHSMGGLHLTAAGAGGTGHRSATHLVYVTATMLDAEMPPDAGTFNVTDALLHDGERVRADPEMAASIFYNRCDPEVAAWATSRLRAMSVASLVPPPSATVAWRTVPSTYIVCTDDRVIRPDGQRRMAANAGSRLEIDADHSPFLSKTGQLADLLADVCRSCAS